MTPSRRLEIYESALSQYTEDYSDYDGLCFYLFQFMSTSENSEWHSLRYKNQHPSSIMFPEFWAQRPPEEELIYGCFWWPLTEEGIILRIKAMERAIEQVKLKMI